MTRIVDSYEVIAFDWDGTVVDSVPYKIAQNKALAWEFGNQLTEDEVRTIWNQTDGGFVQLMQNLTGTSDMDAIMEVVKRDYNKPQYAKRQFNFGMKVVERLRAEGKKLALVTGATREILAADSAALGFEPIERHFDFTMTSDECEYKKPDPRVFGPLLQRLNTLPSQVLYVGDEIKDSTAALGAGMGFVGVESGMVTKSEFSSLGLDSVRHIDELLRV